MQWNYDTIKRLAREAGCNVPDLCALSPMNDPFYTGRPAERAAAEWFTDLWNRFGYTTGVHLRRVHYQVVSQDPPMRRPDGTLYENTENCWAYLCNAGKWARYLGLIDPTTFVDRRNPEAMVFAHWQSENDELGFEVYQPNWYDFTLHISLPDLPRLSDWPYPPHLWTTGYDGIQQGYLVEVWAEKSTMNDVLMPLCEQYNANLVTGVGELSITAVVNFLLERVSEADRPARILYISDFDPAGLGMPISVARKIEYYQRNGEYGKWDIRLDPIVLTADQVAEYDLPRVPVKDSDLRKANWERDHGEGQVELDALEALYPGELRQIVEAAILRYYDPGLKERAQQQELTLQDVLNQKRNEVLDQYSEELAELEANYSELGKEYQTLRQQFAKQVTIFQPMLDDIRARLGELAEQGRDLHGRISDDLTEVDVDVDDYPLPEPDLPPESDSLLYVSGRDYLNQLAVYKAYRHGDNGSEVSA